MQIDIGRMNEYNSYNVSILKTLHAIGQITSRELQEGMTGIEILNSIYRTVENYKTVDGQIEVIGALE